MEKALEVRRRRLMESIEADAFLVFDLDRIMPPRMDSVSLRYLTGYRGEGALLIDEDGAQLFTDSRYLEQAEREVPNLPCIHAEWTYLDELASAIRSKGIRRLAYAAFRMTDHVVTSLREAAGVEMVAFLDPVSDLRAVKDDAELEILAETIRIAETALAGLLPSIRPGVNEVELAQELTERMRDLGADGAAFGPTVASGPNSALPHYRPALGKRTIQEGDFVLFDFGAAVNGYISDISRTFVCGAPSAKHIDIYNTVRRSVDAGLEAVRAGVPGCDVHAAASRVIEASAFAEYVFLSPVGHGIGLEVHEAPRVGPQMSEPLRAGTIMTMEPGIYIPGFGGVRIEEIIRVTDQGHDLLTSFPCAELTLVPA